MAIRFQFSIRFLLVATALVALALAVLNTPNAWVSGPGLLVLAPGIPAVMLIVILRSSGYRRAFFVGAIFPACAAQVVVLNELFGAVFTRPGFTPEGIAAFLRIMSSYDARFDVGVCWTTIPFSGLLCIGVEWILGKENPA